MLLINDTPDILILWKRLFEAHRPDGINITVLQYPSGTAAVASHPPRIDLVMMDPGAVSLERHEYDLLHDYYPSAEWWLAYCVDPEAIAPLFRQISTLHSSTLTKKVAWHRGGAVGHQIQKYFQDFEDALL